MRSIRVSFVNVPTVRNAQNTIWMLELFQERFIVTTVYGHIVHIACNEFRETVDNIPSDIIF